MHFTVWDQGNEIVLADAHFSGHSIHNKVIRAEGLKIDALLEDIMPLFILDQYVKNPLSMMAPSEGDRLDPKVEVSYLKFIRISWPDTQPPERIESFAFYNRARKTYTVVMTGDTAKYGTLILKEEVTPC